MAATRSTQPIPLGSPTAPATRVVGRRVAQFAVDCVLSSILPVLCLALFLIVPLGADGRVQSPGLAGFVAILIVVLAVAAYAWYWVIRPAGHQGRTIGMGLFGIRVVGSEGEPVNAGRLAIRWALLVVDMLPGIGLVGMAVMLLTRRHQRLGDLAARTVVVRDR